MDTPAAFDPADLGTPLNSAPTLTNFAQTRYNLLAQRPARTSTKLPYMTYEQIASNQDVYDPTDFKTVGERIRENVKQAVLSRFPLSNDQYTLRIENLEYEKPKRQHLRDEKEAILNNASLGDRLRGDWVLIDNATGKELQRKTATLMNVPRMTERGTFIRNGSELALKHMFRLRPGVYARIKDNGIIAAHINPAQTTGRQMSMELDPETGVLYMTRGTRMYGVLPMLRAAGMSEDAIRTAWGDELYQMNLSKYGRLMDESDGNKRAVTTMNEYRDLWNNEISKTLLDPETTKSTLGVAYDRITPDTLLQTSKKILKIAREADTLDLDDRDGLQFQKVLGPADYIAERIVRDGGGVLRTLFNRVSRKGTLDDVGPGEFQPHVDSVFMEGKHAGYIEGSSPMESLDFNTGVSRLGEGGIGDTRAAPAESRGVQDSFAGFIDPIRCFAVGHTVLIREPDGVERWKPLETVTMDDLVGCWIDDVLQFRKPLEIHQYPYDGELILFDNGTSACFVTPNHRMHVIYASEMDRGLLDLATEIGTDDQGIVSHFVVRADELLDSKTVALASLTVDNTLTASLFHQSEIQRVPYNGFVYCLSVPGERLFVKYQESSNILSMNSPESLKVGLDVYLTHGALKDSKGNLYTRMRTKDGSVNYVDMTTAANAIVATPEFYDPKADPNERIPAFFHGKGIEYVPRKDVDFYLASSNNMMSTGAGMIPLIGGIRSNRTLMGCLHPDTILCIYRNGERLHIYAKEYLTQSKAGDMVLSLDEQMNPCFRPVRQVLDVHQDLDVYEVKTATGKTIVVNGNHKWLTFTNKNDHCELLPTTDLRRDMFVPVEDSRMRSDDNQQQKLVFPALARQLSDALDCWELTEDVAWVLGLYAAEGHAAHTDDATGKTRRTGIEIACVRKEIRERAMNILTNQMNVHVTIGKQARYPEGCSVRVLRSQIGQLFAQLFGETAATKRVPACIFQSTRACQVAFLMGYLDGDGAVAYERGRVRVSCTTISEQLAIDIAAIMRMLGIHAFYSVSRNQNGFVYRVEISKSDFEKLGTFTHSEKAARMLKCDGQYRRHALRAPYTADMYQACLTKFGGRSTELKRVRTGSISADFFKDNGIHVSPILEHVEWERIVSVTPAGTAEYLVDLDVDDNVYMLANGVFTHNSKYPLQALPLKHRQAPGVQRLLTLPDGTQTTTERYIGKYLGAKFAPVNGTILSVEPDSIVMRGTDGKKYEIDLYHNFPANQKGYITNHPVVQPGQKVKANEILAPSNYTDENGVAALGTNLRVAFRNGRNAGTFEDAIRISDEAAELLGSEQMYKTRGDVTPDIEYGKQKYLSLFRSNEFTREQLDQLGDDGVVKVGTVLKKGDPIMMGVQHKDQSTRGIARNAATPYLSVWEHDYPGTVMDVARGRKHLTVYTQAYTPMQVGDKMCYDEETQIFTDRGWLYFKDLRGDDRVLTLNPQSGESYLINFVRAYQYAYKGKMYSLQTPDLDILVTPNHRHLVARNCDCTYMRLMFSTEIFGKCVYHLTNVRVEDENSYKCSKVEGAVEEWVDYDGMIYCVEVPYTHTVFVRRNGKTVWSGNSSRYGSKGTVSCYDEDTMVYTDQGFKPFSQLRVEDKVAVLDPASNTFQFEHPSAIHSGPYKGLMYGYRDRNLDWLVTPTHDMWCKRAHRNHKGDTTYQEFGRVNVQTVQGYAWLHQVAAPHRDLVQQTARAKELLDTIRRDPVTEVRSVAEARQRACIRYGLHAIIEQEQQYSRTLFRLRVSDCRTAQSKQRAREDGYYTKEYDGFVYCCTVSTGILLVARNGKPMWCGNSIVPKEEMLRDSQGRPVHIELSPLGTTSRLNTALLADANLGKIAEKTGKPVILPDFLTDDTIPDFVEKELKKHGLTESEDLFDPVSGKTVKDVATGIVFHYKLKHMSESKQGARSTGEYTAEDLPMKGGKTGARRLGNMEVSALAAHGADQVLRDAKLIRGQRNDEFWRSFRDGMTPTPPSSPLVNQKFFAHLRAAGISLEEYPDRVHMYGATDQDIKKLTGQRRVSFANTFDSKHLQPVPGGLFDPAIFGADGEQWGYYELPEPVLNPMMFKATANALGWKDKELEGVLKGERQVNGKVGIDGLQDALEHLDIDKELRLAKQTLRAPRVPLSKRDQARKKIRALQPMADAGVKPTDFLLTRIPILPPRYRPVSKMANDVNIAADVNFLYKRMIDAAEDLKEAKSVLPEEAQMDARTSLYQALEAVTGLSETDDPKLQAKNVSGVLKWAFGKGSPKLSAAHRKLFGVAVDLGGRGVVVPDNSLTIDEVGLPEETAWKMFEPFVLRKLRQRGYRMLDALRYTTDRTPEARKLLEEAMAERPILVNRAPTLWKYGIMGFFPKLRGKPGERNTIFTNPNIAKPFGLDHDGDSIWNLVSIACKLDSLKQIFKENGNAPLIFSENSVSCMSETTTGGTMLKEGSQIYDVNHITVAIEDIPIIPESHRVDDNGNEEWDVPEGFFVYTMEREEGACGLAPITKKSLHKNIQMFDVTTAVSGAYTQVITCSADKSLVAYADDGTLALMTPAEVKGHPIPYLVATDTGNAPGFCAKYIKIGTQQSLSFDLGVFIGAMLGDGWVDSQDGAWIAAEHPDIQNALIDLLRNKLSIAQTEAGARLYEYDSHERFGGAVAHRINCGIPRPVGRELRDLIGTGAINKRIPVACMHGSRAHLIGLLVGLLATDGCIHCGTKAPRGKKTVAKSIVMHTTSPLLRDGIQQICKQLGVRTTASPYKGVNSVHTCYAIALSITDTARLYRKEPKFRMLDSVDQASLERIVESLENSDAPDKYDLVPFPRQLRSELTYAGIGGQGKKHHIVRASEITTYDQRGSMPRTIALQMVETLRNVDWTQYTQNLYIAKEKRTYHTPEQAAALVAAWCDIVENTEIGWRNVVDVQPAGVMDAWDLTVPGPYTFALSDGTIVQDTMNLHTPVSKQAVQNVIQKMLPSRNLLSPKNMKAHYLPQAEFLQGLYLGTRSRPDQKPVRFRSAAEMLKALRRGEITYDTPVEIMD